MRKFFNFRRGLLAASAVAALQVAGPVGAQYATYPQQPAGYQQSAPQQYAAPAQAPAAYGPVAQPQQQYLPQQGQVA